MHFWYHQVRIASENNIDFMATGGGHGYTTTYMAMKNGISIQMRPAFAQAPVIDTAANTMTIGGGTRFNQTFDPLFDAGKEIRKAFAPPGNDSWLMYGNRGRLRHMCRHGRRHSRCRSGPIPRSARSDHRRAIIRADRGRLGRTRDRILDGKQRPFLGRSRRGRQFRHHHIRDLQDRRSYEQRPGAQCRFSISGQQKRVGVEYYEDLE